MEIARYATLPGGSLWGNKIRLRRGNDSITGSNRGVSQEQVRPGLAAPDEKPFSAAHKIRIDATKKEDHQPDQALDRALHG